MNLRRYRKKATQFVTAVQIDLDLSPTDGFLIYEKWGSEQRCKRGDWLVNNGGEVYTIADGIFEKTYDEVAPGQYVKSAPVWAKQASRDGKIPTESGETKYSPGDYLVSNREDGADGYAVEPTRFEAMYEIDD